MGARRSRLTQTTTHTPRLTARHTAAPTDPTWYRITNRAGTSRTAVVDIMGEIGYYGATAADLVHALRELDVDTIELNLASPGGEVFEGLAIYQALIDHPAAVIVTIPSLAASIASVIAQAGDEVRIAENAKMMIHDAAAYCQGQAADMRATAELLDGVSDNMASLYATRSGVGTVKSWRTAMTQNGLMGTWYSAAEAVAAGLADTVVKNGARGEDAEAVWQRSTIARLIAAAAGDPPPAPVAVDPDPPAPDPEPDPFIDEDVTVILEAADLEGLAAALAEHLADDTVPGYDPATLAAALAEAVGNAPAPTAPVRQPTDGPILPSSRRTDPEPTPQPEPEPARKVTFDADELAAALADWSAPAPSTSSTTAPPTPPSDEALGAAIVRALQEATQ